MTISVNVEINGGTPAFKDFAGDITVYALINALGLPAGSSVYINRSETPSSGHATIKHGDYIEIEFAAAPAYAAPAAASKVLFINNDGGGFADSVAFTPGTTLAAFISGRGVSIANKMVRVNNNLADAGYVLQNGDKVSVTPLKVQGAVETIKVLYINNDGAGFASSVQTIDGITLTQFLAQQGLNDIRGKLVRVNNEISTAATVLRNGDKISVTPLKVQGA